MSDIMRPIPFSQLMDWVLEEYRASGSVFGVSKMPRHADGKTMPLFDEKVESPFGPAAGPNTQLAQNIIASYAAGSRFFELKTVQIMDGEELSKCVNKPCITAQDECYNCEWSTELYVPQAFDEYVKAWFACKLMAKELELGDPEAFVFNMSVGYDLAGIQSEKVDRYIEGMKDASGSAVWAECRAWARENLSRLPGIDEAYIDGINPHICTSITLSTLHGCPPDEIERIATYLITVKKLNTYIKCNPTLLGYEFARSTLDGMGYDYIVFDDHHFKADLQFSDAIPMFRRLMALCEENGVEFGVKLTNTFPVTIAAGELPGEEMYMSGKSLYPLSISLAERVEKAFDGKLRVSYSGGADQYNIAVRVPGLEKEQVIHVDKMCNECGNCAVFCPYISAPYKDKFTLFASAGDMADSTNAGFCVLDAGAQRVKVRLGGEEYETELASDTRTDASIRALMQAVIRDYAYCL